MKTIPTILFLSLTITSSVCADEPPTFKQKGELEREFYSKVCVSILKAAHFTGKDPKMIDFEKKEIKKGRTNIVFKGSYKGRVTGKKYLANITVRLDTLDEGPPEVLQIKYSDNNNIPYSRKKIDELIEKLNGKK